MSISLGRQIYKKICYLTFDLGVKVRGNIAQFHLHHVTNATAKIKAVLSKGLGGDALSRKYKKIHYLTFDLDQGPLKHCPVPLTSCDLNASASFEVTMANGLGEFINKKIHYLTFDIDLGFKVTQTPNSTLFIK